MHHAAAENLEPVLALAEADLAPLARALDIDLGRRFGEGEERRAKTHLHLVHLEEGLAEFLEHPLHVADMGLFIDYQPLDLVEHRGVGLVGIVAIGAPGNDHADRRLLRRHGADLDRAGMGAQHLARAGRIRLHEEGIVHFPRGMPLGEVERGEIQVIRLDIGTFRDGKTHIGEDRGQFVDDLADRMDAPARLGSLAHRQGDVDPLGGKASFERRSGERLAADIDRLLDGVAQPVDHGALRLALLRRHAAEGFEQIGDRALLAERSDAQLFERRLVLGLGDMGEQIAFELFEIGHRSL